MCDCWERLTSIIPECHFYVGVFCQTFGDPNSGVRSATTGQQFSCRDFTQGTMLYVPAGTNSPYIKASSVSCRGCVSPCQSCNGPTSLIFGIKPGGNGLGRVNDAGVGAWERRNGNVAVRQLDGNNTLHGHDRMRDPTIGHYRRRKKVEL